MHCLWRPEEGVGVPGTVVNRNHHVDVGTQDFWKSSNPLNCDAIAPAPHLSPGSRLSQASLKLDR